LRYDFIRQEKKAYPVTILCKVMEVSRSGFYHYFFKIALIVSRLGILPTTLTSPSTARAGVIITPNAMIW